MQVVPGEGQGIRKRFPRIPLSFPTAHEKMGFLFLELESRNIFLQGPGQRKGRSHTLSLGNLDMDVRTI
ncbi:hypothetical protein BOX30_04390 [Leptospirillum ferriphilum]|uniref:Uncharacterized protein n=3 Tax=Leptospirillum ferriphilum TaxID=178606 RepID=A0A059XXW6_9BACT|nr:hypothetical protein LFML04_1338 [Leptospirillum ferriphilum ML-04]AIA31723.1 hypothetical protein Y981_06545 [Leptospirillum ferriphilum YSK]AKS23516.1 hypothetical protein ABH19_06765 [Leptospirillum sp. Group II 'CF-1']OOH74643.1 hypothetical protein BOX24_01415 [Leptospirillum ferriphilum]OOH81752.1 hypothetical protein BOX30_04390 [Leptospirillum ferriphilum]